jgi:beta-lactamase regulating signal transducer with metallopeptidase domain
MTWWMLLYLLNSAWQIPLLAACALLILRLLRDAESRLKHRVWVTCFCLAIAVPAVSLLRNEATGLPIGIQSASQRDRATSGPASRGLLSIHVDLTAPTRKNRIVAPVLLGAYLLSVLYGTLRLILLSARTRYLAVTAVAIELPSEVRQWFPELQGSEGRPPVAAFASANLNGPATLNWPTPKLLVPNHFFANSLPDVVAAIGHELAHIRRRDFVLNFIYEAVMVVAFYHPALHWLKRQIDASREIVCDELAAEETTGRMAYAHTLFRLATQRNKGGPSINLALGAFQTTTLEDRIMALTRKPDNISAARRFLRHMIATIALVVTATSAFMFSLRPALARPLDQQFATTAEPNARNVSSADISEERGTVSGNSLMGSTPAQTHPGQSVRGNGVAAFRGEQQTATGKSKENRGQASQPLLVGRIASLNSGFSSLPSGFLGLSGRLSPLGPASLGFQGLSANSRSSRRSDTQD